MANFYEDIYQGERNFGDDNALPNFIDDNDEAGNQDDDIEFAMETLVDAGDDDQDNVVADQTDSNRDPEAEEDIEPSTTQSILKKQRFSDYTKVCNVDNYDKLPEQEEETFVWSNKARDRYEWCTLKKGAVENVCGRGRKPATQINSPGGPSPTARKEATSPADTWSLMIEDDLLMKVVDNTNRKITELHNIIGDRLAETDKKTQYGLTSLVEMKAWFGLLYLRGALKLNTSHVDNVWYHESSNDIFAATMQRKRFTFLTRMVQFDDCDTRGERWKQDKFAAFREFFETVNRRFLKRRKPSEHTAIDETLYSYRGRISFKQYNPSKPAKYGLLFRSLCDSTVQYTYISLPYAGKPTGTPDAYYVTGTDKYTEYLVTYALQEGGKECMKGRNIALDRYFTSMAIAEWCLERNITITGTLKSDRKGIPNEMKAPP